MILELERTADILGSMRAEFGFSGILVGFAAETHDVENYARGKLERKRCDMIVANDVSRSDIGFNSSENEVLLVYPDRTEFLEKRLKHKLPFKSLSALAVSHREKLRHGARQTRSTLEAAGSLPHDLMLACKCRPPFPEPHFHSSCPSLFRI